MKMRSLDKLRQSLWPRRATLMGLSMLSALAFTMSYEAGNLIAVFSGGGVNGALLAAICYLLFDRTLLRGAKKGLSVYIPALLMAFFMLFGGMFMANDDWSFLTSGPREMLVCAAAYAGYAVFFVAAVLGLYQALEKKRSPRPSALAGNRLVQKGERHPLLAAFVVLMLCWLPYVLIQFPGVLVPDTYDQLKQYMGFGSWSSNAARLVEGGSLINTHHPVPYTVLVGAVYTAFWKAGMGDLGVFLVGSVQLMAQGWILAYALSYMKRAGMPLWARLLALLYYAFMPYFPMFGFALVKDTPFHLAGVILFIYLMELTKAPERALTDRKRWLPGALAMLLFMLFRKTGLYILAIEAVFAVPYVYRRHLAGRLTLRAAALFAVPIALFLLIENVAYPALGVGKGSIGEMFSLPFQQTARYMRDYRDEVTEEEYAAIDRVLDADGIAERYRSSSADPVKITFRKEATSAELMDYFRVWFEQLKKHPGSYVETAMAGVYGYFYPELSTAYAYIGNLGETDDGTPRGVPGYIETTKIGFLQPFVTLLYLAVHLFRRLPVLGLSMNVAIQTWVWMLTVAYLARHRRIRYALPTVLLAGVLLMCIISPLNGSARYVMFMYYALPLMLTSLKGQEAE